MKKTSLLQLILYILFTCLMVSFAFAFFLPASAVHAAGAQLVLSQPGTNVNPQNIGGPVGVKVRLDGSGFAPNITLTLYTTPTNNAQNCQGGGNPDQLGLTPFNRPPTTVVTQGDGSFTLVTQWPGTANTQGVSYFVCAAPQNQPGTLSSNTFTVTPAPKITITPTTINPGGQLTVTGMSWYPPQALTLTISDGNGNQVFTTAITPDSQGNINQQLTIPTTVQDGTYTMKLAANSEQALSVTQNNALTVTGSAAPTPAPSPSPTITPTVTASPTVTPTTPPTTPGNGGSNNTGSSSSNFLLFMLAGVGALLIIVGIILFVLYSRSTQSQ